MFSTTPEAHLLVEGEGRGVIRPGSAVVAAAQDAVTAIGI